MTGVTAGLAAALALGTTAAMPPLTDEQITRLETARDGFDHREEAYFALIENMRAWDGTLRDTPVRLEPDFEALVENPIAHRGAVCRIAGRLEQRYVPDPPYDAAVEWFVRPDAARPVIAYVVGADPTIGAFRDGERVELFGRFYKRMRFAARDGVERDYPAFVAAHPRRVGTATQGTALLWATVVPVGVMLLAFALLLVYVRRQRGADSQRGSRSRAGLLEAAAQLDEGGPLPDDPVEALAELKRRADAMPQTDPPPADDADAFRSTS